MTGTNTPLFEMTGASDPFGLWSASQTPRQPDSGMVNFGIGDEQDSAPTDEPGVVTWRINLPEDAGNAAIALDRGEQSLARTQSALESVPVQLDALVAKLNQPTPEQSGDAVHFAVNEPDIAPDSPEAELLGLIHDADSSAKAAEGPVQYGLSDNLSGALDQVQAEFDALLEQVNREMLHFAWVETSVAGLLAARTMVDWSGDANTFWTGNTSLQHMQLHQRSVKMAIETRNMRLRMVATIASGAARISMLCATPGGALMALPMAFKYTSALISQVKQYQNLNS